MGLEILSELEILRAILSIVFFGISLVIGGQILYKFAIHKRKELLSVGLTLILFSNPWWGVIFSFLSILIVGIPLTQAQFLFVADFFTPWLFMFWIYSFAELMYPNKK